MRRLADLMPARAPVHSRHTDGTGASALPQTPHRDGGLGSLWVKKGGNACKITIYKQIPIEQKQAIELSLAKQVVAKL